MIWWGYFCIRAEKGYDNMAVIKTAILQTHVYTENPVTSFRQQKFLPVRNFRESTWQFCPKCSAVPTRTNTSRNMRNPKAGTPGKNVPGWQQNVGFIS